MGLPILPHLRRQMPYRIGDYSGTTSSLYLRQAQQPLNLGFSFIEINRLQGKTMHGKQRIPHPPLFRVSSLTHGVSVAHFEEEVNPGRAGRDLPSEGTATAVAFPTTGFPHSFEVPS
jgi:hypothetical protein